MKADHFAFQVSDLDAAIAFYTDTIGLKLRFKEIDVEHHEAYAFLELEGGDLELLQRLDEAGRPAAFSKPEVGPPYTPHLALATSDLDALLATVVARGVPVVKGPLEMPGKVRWVYLSDPDHNIIEIVQWM